MQIRTRRMDEIAERGLAAHWKYKGVKAESGLDEFLNTVRAYLEEKENNPLDLMQDFKMDLYKDEIYVFTPTGELIKLAKGCHRARLCLCHPFKAGMQMRFRQGK